MWRGCRMRIESGALYLLTLAIVTLPALAQRAPFEFEVVSIRSVPRGPGMPIGIPNPTPNGFTATAAMWQLLSFAYGPSSAAGNAAAWQITEMRNEPGWVHEKIYAID